MFRLFASGPGFKSYICACTKKILDRSGVNNENGNWYLLAYCHSRCDYRNFRLDRIQKLAVPGKYFEQDHPSVNELNVLHHSRYFTEIMVSIDRKYAHFLSFERDKFHYLYHSI